MEKETGIFETLINDTREYFHARQELLKLQVTDKISGVLSSIITFFIIFSIFLLAFLFVSFTLAHVFAELWGHEYAGYLSVTLLYTIIGLLLYRFRKTRLFNPIKNKIIQQILSKKPND